MNLRRIRYNHHVRELTASVQLSHKDFIQPLFVDETIDKKTPITNLNGMNSDTIDSVIEQIHSDLENGISKFLLFPIVEQKTEGNFDFHFILNAVEKIRGHFGQTIWIAADVCLCGYTSHGHCGILNEKKNVLLNDETSKELGRYALQLAKAGVDCIAPSDMMDGRIGAIRNMLDEKGFEYVSVMSYSSKFSSQFYGPFRDVCRSSPGNNTILRDRKTYQISPFNPDDAVRSAIRDLEEGADFVMVKPATHYLDIIHKLKQTIHHPIVAYHVSGEYQGLELLVQNDLADRVKVHAEAWTSLKRAGADSIISYASRHARNWINQIEY